MSWISQLAKTAGPPIKWPLLQQSELHLCFAAKAYFSRCTPKLSLPLSLATLALGSHSLPGIRSQPQCCDDRWQLAQKGWHVIGKCAAAKMSFLIKRFWSAVNCRKLGGGELACGLKYKGSIWKSDVVLCSARSSLCNEERKLSRTKSVRSPWSAATSAFNWYPAPHLYLTTCRRRLSALVLWHLSGGFSWQELVRPRGVRWEQGPRFDRGCSLTDG